MRVLWFSITPSLYDEKLYGGWVASLEMIICKYSPNIELGIAFEHEDNCFKQSRDGVTYYPICKNTGIKRKIDTLLHYDSVWKYLRKPCLKIIEDFKPDIIQCFGSEWPFGLLVQHTNIPIVIHMQGFSNIYRLSSSLCSRTSDHYKYYHYNFFSIFHYWYRATKENASDMREQTIMRQNHFFMGRTDWDRNIVKYYSPNAVYFHCPEAIRPEIYHSKRHWQFSRKPKMRLITISSASGLKGNDLILRTAYIMKEFGFDFEWRVAGNKNTFDFFESIIGLKHENLGIKLLGYIDTKTIVDELCEADAYVHTAIIDNSPNSLCEAQLIGCPVVSTNVGGIPQLVENNVSGMLYPFAEPHTLAFILMNIHNDQEKLEKISANEITMARDRHDEGKIADRLVHIYEDILLRNNKQ